MGVALDAYFGALVASQPSGWRPDKELAARALAVQEGIVVLCGAMKSGTTLLVELLDNNPQLIVMPGDSHLLASLSAEGSADARELSRHWLQRFINPKGQLPFWSYGQMEAPYISLLCWMKYWRGVLGDLDRGPFLAAVLSHYCANPHRPARPNGWVVKTPGNEFHVERFLALFPQAIFVHVFRDPRENLASLKRLYAVRGWRWSAVAQSQRLARSFAAGLENRKRLGANRYYCCRYEDVIRTPRTSMQRLAGFLRIHMTDDLLVPTINGRLTKANSMVAGDQVVGRIRRRSSSVRPQVLGHAEQDVLLSYAGRIAGRLGYEYGRGNIGLARVRHRARMSGTYARRLWAAVRSRLATDDR